MQKNLKRIFQLLKSNKQSLTGGTAEWNHLCN